MSALRHSKSRIAGRAGKKPRPVASPASGGSARWRKWLIRSACCCALLLATLGEARGETLSVMQFNEKMKEWKRDQKDPPPLTYTVEGRVTLYSESGVRLKNCKAVFHSKTEIPRLASKSSNLELTGKVSYEKRTEEFTFEVISAREVSGDGERYHELHRKLRQQHPEKWYELGEWAQARGEFYDDDELLTHSKDAFRQGLELERKALAKDNPEGLLKLVEKAKRFPLLSGFRAELTHEAFYLLTAQSRDKSVTELLDLAKRMERSLPDCIKRLDYLPADLIKDYRDRPLETYAAANNETRLKIHRLLYSELLLRTITPGLAADGSNGFDIADKIHRLVPEYENLEEGFRDRELAALAGTVEKLPRSEMLVLADRYRARKQDQEAGRLIKRWLTFRLEKLEEDDTEGLLEVSEDYRRLLKQRDVADRLLIDAWKRNSKATDIAERLEKEGYHLDGKTWLSAAEFNARLEGQMERAIREGRVEPGMTSSQVRRSLGEPASLARAATAGQVIEVWRFDLAGSTHLLVRFVRRAGQPDLTVVDVADSRSQ